MKNTLVYIVGGLLLVGIFGLGYWAGHGVGQRQQLKKDLPVQEQLQSQVDSLDNLVKAVENSVIQYSSEKDSLEMELTKAMWNYSLIEKKYNEKINSVIEYTPSDCQQFFSDRYPE